MQEEREKKKNRHLDWLLGLLGFFIVAGLAAACLYRTVSYDGFRIDRCHKIQDSFKVSWGNQEITTTLPATIKNTNMEPVYITINLHKEELGKGDSILFRSRQNRARIYLDDMLLFDSGEAFDCPFPMGYGSFWKSLQIGEDYDGQTLTIELQPGYDMQDVSGYIPAVYFGTQASFIAMILSRVLWFLLLTFLLILLGIYDIIYGMVTIYRQKMDKMFFLGLFSVATGIWMLIECHVLELFIKNMQPVVYLSYMAYGLMPVLLIRFLLSHEEFKEKFYLKAIYLIGIVLNLAQMFLAATGICSYFESQWLNRIYLGLTVAGLLVALFSVGRIKKEQKKEPLYGGILILVLSTILELFYFLFVSKESSGRILVIGISLFIFKSGIDQILEVKKLKKDNLEKEILKNMAYTDAMTHLGNRFAYEQEKNRLERKEQTQVIILIADMNGLKQANDSYGHIYGDQIIRETARILEESFKDVGQCFRIGGDEFCVLAENVNRQVFETCIRKMEERASELHESIKEYGIASGVAEGESQNIEDLFHEADNLMYARKKEMKARKSIGKKF